jgi:hypothetical protein
MKINSIHRLSNTGAMVRNRSYQSAHGGNLLSAFRLVDELIPDFSQFGSLSAFVCPVQKLSGNKIPLALSTRMVQHSDAVLCDTIFLTNERPGTKMIDRMFFQPEFTGEVRPGRYILVDDVFTTGITLKALKTYIERNGGNVISAYTLGSSKSTLFEASRLQLKILRGRYPEADKYFDLSLLTIIQMEYLLKFNSIKNLNVLYSEHHHLKQFS